MKLQRCDTPAEFDVGARCGDPSPPLYALPLPTTILPVLALQPPRAGRMSPSEPTRFSQQTGRPWLRLTGAGMELAGTMLVFGAVGYAIDRRLGAAQHLAVALFGLVGFTVGMYRFIRLAMAISHEQRVAEVLEEEQECLPESSDGE